MMIEGVCSLIKFVADDEKKRGKRWLWRRAGLSVVIGSRMNAFLRKNDNNRKLQLERYSKYNTLCEIGHPHSLCITNNRGGTQY